MNAPRIRTVPFAPVLVATLLLACASTGPPQYWTGFYPTYSNFERHFDERSQDLDPIEGIWASQDTRTAKADSFIIIRDSSYADYDFVGVRLPQVLPVTGQRVQTDKPLGPVAIVFSSSSARSKAELFVALRRSAGDEHVYEYTDAAVLRGEDCADETCLGVYFIAADGRLHRQRAADEDHSSGCGWTKRYPPP